MKNTFKLFGIIAVIAVIGFSMAGCDNGSPAGPGGEPPLPPLDFTVTFDTSFGTPVPAQNVPEGGFAARPADDPTRAFGHGAGLWAHPMPGYIFDGWFAPEAIVEFAFATTPITEDITLLAHWTAPAPIATTVPAAMAHVSNAENPGAFTLLLGADVTLTGAAWTLAENVHLTVEGIGERRTITRSGNGTLFTVTGEYRSLTLGYNITLEGHSGNNNPLVNVLAGGSLTMNAGAWITGNTVSGSGVPGAVNVSGAGSTFTMNGGKISGNTANDSSGGGVRVAVGASFVMHEGAVIRNNTTTGNNSGGGVIVVTAASFVMHEGAVIRDNEAEGNNSAGGVFVGDAGSTFTMLGGEIRGNEATGTASTVGGVRVNIGAFQMVTGVIYGGDEGDTNSNTGVTNHALLLTAGGTATLGTMVGGVFTPADPAVTLGNTDDTIRVEDGVRQQ